MTHDPVTPWELANALRGLGVEPGDGPPPGPRPVEPPEVVWSSEERSYGWQVATHARAYLERKADQLELRADQLRGEVAAAKVRCELAGLPWNPELERRAGAWHEARARGARERPERVDKCGKDRVFEVSCSACGCQHERPARCDCGLLCAGCRGHRKVDLQAHFMRSRAEVMARALRAGVLRRSLPGGRYTEKFLTLTVPHGGLDLGERIETAFDAWRRFVPKLRRYMREHEQQFLRREPGEDGARSWWYFRRFEWTPGTDGQGHPHFHLWLLCPYLPRDTVRQWWVDALRAAKKADGSRAYAPGELDTVLTPDVRECHGDVSRELIKYITKDWHEGKRLAPHVYARVFEALDGRRLTQASRGFMALGEQIRWCSDCKDFAPGWVELRAARPGELDEIRARRRARGPPARAPVEGGEVPIGGAVAGWARVRA
jgi:hypothetical protein